MYKTVYTTSIYILYIFQIHFEYCKNDMEVCAVWHMKCCNGNQLYRKKFVHKLFQHCARLCVCVRVQTLFSVLVEKRGRGFKL